jgi:hypothetical protein
MRFGGGYRLFMATQIGVPLLKRQAKMATWSIVITVTPIELQGCPASLEDGLVIVWARADGANNINSPRNKTNLRLIVAPIHEGHLPLRTYARKVKF